MTVIKYNGKNANDIMQKLNNNAEKMFGSTRNEDVAKFYNIQFGEDSIDMFPALCFTACRFTDIVLVQDDLKAALNKADLQKTYTTMDKAIAATQQSLKMWKDNKAENAFIPFPSVKNFSGDGYTLIQFFDAQFAKDCLKSLYTRCMRGYMTTYLDADGKFKDDNAYNNVMEIENTNIPLVSAFFFYATIVWLQTTTKYITNDIKIEWPENLDNILKHCMPKNSAYYKSRIASSNTAPLPSTIIEKIFAERIQEFQLTYDGNQGLKDALIASLEDEKTIHDIQEYSYLINAERMEDIYTMCYEANRRMSASENLLKRPDELIRDIFIQKMMDSNARKAGMIESQKEMENEGLRTENKQLKTEKEKLQQELKNANNKNTLVKNDYEKRLESAKKEYQDQLDKLSGQKNSVSDEAYQKLKQEKEDAEELSNIYDTENKQLKEENARLNDTQFKMVEEAGLLKNEIKRLKKLLKLYDTFNITPEQQSDIDEVLNITETVPREEKIEFLKDKSIAICGGDKNNVSSGLKKAGIPNVTDYFNLTKITGKHDIYVCLITKMSHSMDDLATKEAKKNDAVLIYFDFMNTDRLIDEMYEAVLDSYQT